MKFYYHNKKFFPNLHGVRRGKFSLNEKKGKAGNKVKCELKKDLVDNNSSTSPGKDYKIRYSKKIFYVRWALEYLSEKQFEVVFRRYFFGDTWLKISDDLGIELGSVMVHYRRAIHNLKIILGPILFPDFYRIDAFKRRLFKRRIRFPKDDFKRIRPWWLKLRKRKVSFYKKRKFYKGKLKLRRLNRFYGG